MFELVSEGAECRHAVGTVGGVATVASMTHARFLPSPDGGQQSAVSSQASLSSNHHLAII